eukprot:6207502-Pleurochrysis_carterae.AAC.2
MEDFGLGSGPPLVFARESLFATLREGRRTPGSRPAKPAGPVQFPDYSQLRRDRSLLQVGCLRLCRVESVRCIAQIMNYAIRLSRISEPLLKSVCPWQGREMVI